MEIISFPEPIDARSVCAFCLKAALTEIWGQEDVSINIDTMWLLTCNYQQILTNVFTSLKSPYPPELAWSILFRFFVAVEKQRGYSFEDI